MSETDAPKIIFPCAYPIKVMGEAGAGLHEIVYTVMQRHAPGYDETAIVIRDSAQGRFQSITVTITAQSEQQLQNIHRDLRASTLVKMVL